MRPHWIHLIFVLPTINLILLLRLWKISRPDKGWCRLWSLTLIKICTSSDLIPASATLPSKQGFCESDLKCIFLSSILTEYTGKIDTVGLLSGENPTLFLSGLAGDTGLLTHTVTSVSSASQRKASDHEAACLERFIYILTCIKMHTGASEEWCLRWFWVMGWETSAVKGSFILKWIQPSFECLQGNSDWQRKDRLGQRLRVAREVSE